MIKHYTFCAYIMISLLLFSITWHMLTVILNLFVKIQYLHNIYLLNIFCVFSGFFLIITLECYMFLIWMLCMNSGNKNKFTLDFSPLDSMCVRSFTSPHDAKNYSHWSWTTFLKTSKSAQYFARSFFLRPNLFSCFLFSTSATLTFWSWPRSLFTLCSM